MDALLALARLIDRLTDAFARIAEAAVIASCFISAANAVVRYGLDYSSNGWLEIQWYLFAACVMLGAAQVLRVNEHVRVDVLYGRYPVRAKVWIDLLGLAFFLLPVMCAMLWFSVPLLLRMVESQEVSGNAGGLIRWPAMALLPLGFGLVLLQGLSEIVKRIGWLLHRVELSLDYERPLQ
jgi:TRAP-type mannitol/chloroaromatic compound transport system permease small subunit